MILIAALAISASFAPNPELVQSRRAMEEQFNLAINRLRDCRPSNTVKCYYWTQAIPRLRNEQGAWETWRDAKAALNAVEMQGTSGEAEVVTFYEMQLNSRRAAELSKIGRK